LIESIEPRKDRINDQRTKSSYRMTREQFKEARKTLGLSQAALAKTWGMGSNGGRTIRKWKAGKDR